MTLRRYHEAEVRAILECAIDSRDRSLPAVEQGLTLADIQARSGGQDRRYEPRSGGTQHGGRPAPPRWPARRPNAGIRSS